MMTPEELAAIRARCEAATPGLWTSYENREVSPEGYAVCGPTSTDIAYLGITNQDSYDADFIAYARTDVPKLLDEVSRLTAENARLRAVRDAAAAWRDNVDAGSPECDVAMVQSMEAALRAAEGGG